MSLSQYCNPQLFVGGLEIVNVSSVNYIENGGSTINSLKVNLTDPEYDEYKWYNQKVEFYLNYGAQDSVPLFRGYVRQINPTDRNFSFTAMDPRTFLTGKEAAPVVLTKLNNFDGFTISQFIHHYVSKHINTNDTIIGLDMLNEPNPPVLLKKIRTTADPYKFITGNLPTNRDSTKKPYRYSIKMVESATQSNIVINRERDIEDANPVAFSLNDGIVSLKSKRRPPPQFYNLEDKNNKRITYKKGNMPYGPIGHTLKGEFKDSDSALQEAILDSIINEEEVQEVSMTVSKGHYLSTGNVIRLNVEEPELRKNHRIKSRKVSWNDKSGVMSSFTLNKDVPVMKSYIQ